MNSMPLDCHQGMRWFWFCFPQREMNANPLKQYQQPPLRSSVGEYLGAPGDGSSPHEGAVWLLLSGQEEVTHGCSELMGAFGAHVPRG